MLELSFLSAGGFVAPFLLICSDLLASDLVLDVRLRATLVSAAGGAAGFAAGAAGAGSFAGAAAAGGGGGLAPSRRWMGVSERC